ncbi:molybdopterin-guanine dinucleotide biosynthesis protein MobB [Labrys miyagiensis]|uniref:Molybdopterin-guanine dinucleotide biosynthesis protein MobB n=2 Tax=Labrys miyagiensis TaxID=346912 RepID=A0ABQ6CU91_9HYPH|nr:molybdopterin-guanine dinucleotide biosynthesis protein MobB [Labrys miyagiensis]
MMRLMGLSGWSGAGKTTLIAALIPELRRRGLTVSTVKHAHHAFDVDKPGKDSYIHRESGAQEVLVSSAHRFALMHELRGAPEPPLAELLKRLSPVDLVIVEGFKRDPHPKIEIHRVAVDKAFIHPDDPYIRAIATDAPGPFPVPRFDLDDIAAIADWVIREAVPIDQEIAASGSRP